MAPGVAPTESKRIASEARRLVAAHGVSLRQAYRYATAGREPSKTVRVGLDGRRFHVHLCDTEFDIVDVRRIRYAVAAVAKRARAHGIRGSDCAELDATIRKACELAAEWRTWAPPSDQEL